MPRTRRAIAGAAVLAACATASACGSAGSGTTGGSGAAGGSVTPSPSTTATRSADPLTSTTATPSPDPLTPTTTAPIGAGSAPLLPTAAPTSPAAEARRVSLPWDYLGERNSGQQILLRLEVGGCTGFAGVRVAQTPSSVEIEAVGTNNHGAGAVCPALARIIDGVVALRAPLGHRTLLHAPVSSAFSGR